LRYTRIAGTGGYLPEKVLTNGDLEKMVETTDAWIQERTGVEERHIAAPHETTCDLAEIASRRAIEMAGVEPSSFDMIILATTTPDHILPSVATELQARLGAYGCAAFDLQAVCTGFVYALSIADQFIRTGSAERILVVGAEVFSRIVDWSDRATCILFGDGAGAVVVEACAEPGIVASHLHADGRYKELLWVPAGVSAGYDRNHGKSAYVQMRGNEIFKAAVKTLERTVEETLEANHLGPGDVDWLIPHQANERIINAIAKKLGMPVERVVCTVKTHGNTSAASVPLALDVAVRDGRIQRGDTVLLEAFGGGFTWGSILLKY
jgi:3-oxoacyl-[acyl-carrier-protein] synthase-3